MTLCCVPVSDYHFGAQIRALVGDLLALPLDPVRIARIEGAIRDVYPDASVRPTGMAGGTPVLRVERWGGTANPSPLPVPVRAPADGTAGPRRVLLVDPDWRRRAILARSLATRGWTVVMELLPERVLLRLATAPPDALVLGLDGDATLGSELLRQLRDATARPLVVVGERDGPALELLALELGADDFIPADRVASVLAARLAAIERRGSPDRQGAFAWRELAIDQDRRSVCWRGEPIALTRTEFDLLRALVSEHGRVVARASLLERVWGDPEADPRVLETAVHRMRQRFAEAGADDPIATVRGIGHRLATA